MNKKIIIGLMLVATLLLTGCNNNELEDFNLIESNSDSCKVTYTVIDYNYTETIDNITIYPNKIIKEGYSMECLKEASIKGKEDE